MDKGQANICVAKINTICNVTYGYLVNGFDIAKEKIDSLGISAHCKKVYNISMEMTSIEQVVPHTSYIRKEAKKIFGKLSDLTVVLQETKASKTRTKYASKLSSVTQG